MHSYRPVAMYEELISIQKLQSASVSVKFVFELQRDVRVRCSEKFLCETNMDSMLSKLLLESKTGNFSLVTTSGGWKAHRWGRRTDLHSEHSIVTQSPGGTVLLAASPESFDNTQYDSLRTSLASTLGLPIGPTFSDLSNNDRPNRVGLPPTAPGRYSQFFPLVHFNPDTWKYWSNRLLPCRGKAGIATLLNAQTIRSSLWHSLALHVQLVRRGSSDTDLNYELYGIDETRNGSYDVRVSVQLEMVVPHSTALSSSVAREQTADTNTIANKGGNSGPSQHSDIDVIAGVKQASYSKDQSAMCRIPGAAAPRVRYHYTPTDATAAVALPALPQQPLEITLGNGKGAAESVDAFWEAVVADPGTINTDESKPHSYHSGVTLDRALFDSRSLEMTVHTTIHLPATNSITSNADAPASPPPLLTFTEVVPQHYDIDLQSYTYRVISRPDGTERTGLIADLPSFRWTSPDCVAYHSNSTASNNVQHTLYSTAQQYAPHSTDCARTFVFEVPALPNGGMFSTVYRANKRFMSREAQPVDASRGALVPPSILTICDVMHTANLSGSDAGSVRQSIGGCKMMYTDSFLVTAPIPDASMPYNVITLVSTLLAFFMGSFINALLKKPSTPTIAAQDTSTSNASPASEHFTVPSTIITGKVVAEKVDTVQQTMHDCICPDERFTH